MRKLFKISSTQLFLSLVLSVFIGTYLYLINYKKISIEYWINREQIVILNSCTWIDKDVRKVLSNEEIFVNLRSRIKDNFPNGKVSMNLDETFIKLKVNGFLGSTNDYDQFAVDFIQALREAASKKFATLYSHSRVHCNGVDFPALKIYPNYDVVYREQNFRYKLLHLCFLVASPLMTLYLIFVAFNYKKYCLDKQD